MVIGTDTIFHELRLAEVNVADGNRTLNANGVNALLRELVQRLNAQTAAIGHDIDVDNDFKLNFKVDGGYVTVYLHETSSTPGDGVTTLVFSDTTENARYYFATRKSGGVHGGHLWGLEQVYLDVSEDPNEVYPTRVLGIAPYLAKPL